MTKNSLKNWLLASRPKTLSASVSPVLIGTAMAFGDGIHHFGAALVCLIAAVSIQIGTNIANDYFDFINGADTKDRIGPKRVTQSGLIQPGTVKNGFIFAFTIAGIACLWLMNRGGWPLAVIGIISIISGILYTAGPKPLGYIGLGDVFVLIFFGPVAVGGTYYVQSFEMNPAVIMAGFAPGLISVSILVVNNYRDMESDRVSGKRTLAVRFGRAFSQLEYLVCIILAGLIPVYIHFLTEDHKLILLSSVVILLAVPGIKSIFTDTNGIQLNNTLAFTGQLLIIYSILFSIGWVL